MLNASVLELAHTHPPDLVMPAMPQLVTTLLYGAGAVGFMVYALWFARRERSLLPLIYVIGAWLTIFLEPVVDLLGNAVHPQTGQFHFVTSNGHPVPWAVFVGYVWYFAGTPLLCYQMFRDRSLTTDVVWKLFAGVVICAAIVEQIPLYFGVWVYYGEQPMKFGFMPVWWIFANTAAVLVPFVMIYKLFPRLVGWRQWLVAGLMPSGAFMGHAAAGWPMYNALGTQTETLSPLILYGASVASIALSILVVWAVMAVAELPDRRQAVTSTGCDNESSRHAEEASCKSIRLSAIWRSCSRPCRSRLFPRWTPAQASRRPRWSAAF